MGMSSPNLNFAPPPRFRRPTMQQGVSPQLTRQSGDGTTILMHAAKGGNAMALRAVAQSVRRACDPQTVRTIACPCRDFLFARVTGARVTSVLEWWCRAFHASGEANRSWKPYKLQHLAPNALD